jgi:hypothetical protein
MTNLGLDALNGRLPPTTGSAVPKTERLQRLGEHDERRVPQGQLAGRRSRQASHSLP